MASNPSSFFSKSVGNSLNNENDGNSPNNDADQFSVTTWIPLLHRLPKLLVAMKRPFVALSSPATGKLLAQSRMAAFSSEGSEVFLKGEGVGTGAKFFYRLGWGVSIGYCVVDITHHVSNAEQNDKVGVFVEKSFFHGLASLYLPAKVIHVVMHKTSDVIKEPGIRKALVRHLRNVPISSVKIIPRLPVVAGVLALSSIPVIDKSIEHLIKIIYEVKRASYR
jgi:copper chaperone CopZ